MAVIRVANLPLNRVLLGYIVKEFKVTACPKTGCLLYLNFREVKLEWRARNINSNLEQLLLVPFGFLKDVLHQKMTVVILFKEMHGLELSRLLQHLEERVSEQFFK